MKLYRVVHFNRDSGEVEQVGKVYPEIAYARAYRTLITGSRWPDKYKDDYFIQETEASWKKVS